MSLEERVGKVEGDLGSLKIEQAKHGIELRNLRADVSDVGAGVKQLLEREVYRPHAITPKALAVAASGLLAIGAVASWLIGSAPAVQGLDKRIDGVERRIDKLDDPIAGRVTRIEKEFDWSPRVTRAK
jgi:hypothetical protein